MHCTPEKAYHAALFVPSLEPYHHCEIYFFKFERDLDKPPGHPVWDCRLSDPGSLSRTRENGIDGVNVSLVHILEQGFVQMSWQRLSCVLEDHLDCSSAVAGSSGLSFCPFRGSLSLGVWRG